MRREGGRHNQLKTRSHAAPSGGRGVLGIANNPAAVLAARSSKPCCISTNLKVDVASGLPVNTLPDAAGSSLEG